MKKSQFYFLYSNKKTEDTERFLTNKDRGDSSATGPSLKMF